MAENEKDQVGGEPTHVSNVGTVGSSGKAAINEAETDKSYNKGESQTGGASRSTNENVAGDKDTSEPPAKELETADVHGFPKEIPVVPSAPKDREEKNAEEATPNPEFRLSEQTTKNQTTEGIPSSQPLEKAQPTIVDKIAAAAGSSDATSNLQ